MHRIFAMWSHPRSMSTAMERIMRERGDLDCAHEPFMYDYYVHRKVREMPMFDIRPDQPVSYSQIRDMLMARAEAGPVFIKDMSYYCWPQIMADEAFSARLVNFFLVRAPEASIASYFKLDTGACQEEIGIEAQYRHYKALCEAGHNPVVIEANTVRRDPRGTMARLWQEIGLPFEARAFDWQTPTPEDWQQVEGWHGAVSQASGIRPLTAADLERQRQRFEEMALEHPQMRDYLAHHQPYYEALKAQALEPDG